MKVVAVLVCAGLGTRVRHVLNGVSKEMVVVDGKPLLEHYIDTLKVCSWISDIVVCTNTDKIDVTRLALEHGCLVSVEPFDDVYSPDRSLELSIKRYGLDRRDMVVIYPDMYYDVYSVLYALNREMDKCPIVVTNKTDKDVHKLYGNIIDHPSGKYFAEKPETDKGNVCMGVYYVPGAYMYNTMHDICRHKDSKELVVTREFRDFGDPANLESDKIQLVRACPSYDLSHLILDGTTHAVTKLMPYQTTRGHSHPNSEFYFFKDACVLVIDEVHREMPPGSSIVINPNEHHAVVNATGEVATFICVY